MSLDGLIAALVEHGPRLALGGTLLLLAGVVGMLLQRDPARQRGLGAATAIALALYVLAAATPLPRLGSPPPVIADAIVPDAETRAVALRQALADLGEDPLAPRGTAQTATPVAARTLPPTAPAPAFVMPWPTLLAGTFLLGSALASLRLLAGCLRLWRLRRRGSRLPPALLRSLDVPDDLRVVATAADVRPFCAGVLRPIVVVPATLLASDQRTRLRAVLRHEHAHLAAGDPRLCALLALLTVPLFWHPLFWWFARRLRFASELLADERAAPPGERAAYARALLDLAERSPRQRPLAGSLAVFHRPSEFYRRMHMLLQRRSTPSRSPTHLRRAATTFVALALSFTAAAWCGVPLRAQEPVANEKSLAEENQKLRAELDAMRTELKALHDSAQSLQQKEDDRVRDLQVQLDMARRKAALGLGQAPQPTPTRLTPQPPTPAPTEPQSAEATADLVSRYIDLDAEIASTRDEAAQLKALAERGTASTHDARRAEIKLRALQQKQDVVKRLIEGERQATEAELQYLDARIKDFDGGDRTEQLRLCVQRQRTVSRLEALQSVK